MGFFVIPNNLKVIYSYGNTANTYADTSGVAVKFKLPSAPNYAAVQYSGFLRVDGQFTSNNINSGSLAMTYSHSQLALDFTLADAISFATTGVPTFNITGSQDDFSFADQFVR